MLGVFGNLGEEGVGGQHGRLVLVAAWSVAQQRRNIDLESAREAVERGQGRHGLGVFDLRDVGAGHAHAACELALRKIADVAKIAHGGRDLDFAVAGTCDRIGDERDDGLGFGLLGQQTLLATTAGFCGGAELHQFAVVAFEDFTVLRCHSAQHQGLGQRC